MLPKILLFVSMSLAVSACEKVWTFGKVQPAPVADEYQPPSPCRRACSPYLKFKRAYDNGDRGAWLMREWDEAGKLVNVVCSGGLSQCDNYPY